MSTGGLAQPEWSPCIIVISSPDWDPSSVLWIGPNREIVGSGADLSNETLAEVDDLCLAARDGLEGGKKDCFIGKSATEQILF